MKTWILCVDHLGAKLYWRANAEDSVHFWAQIPYPLRPMGNVRFLSSKEIYLQHIAEVTEEVCESAPKGQLIICAEPAIMSSIRLHLGLGMQSKIIGVIDCDLCHVPDERLNESTRGFLDQAEKSWAMAESL